MSIVAICIFVFCLALSMYFFYRGARGVYQNIMLGKPLGTMSDKKRRWQVMVRVALGQSKMGARPIAGFLHLLIYIGFLVVNVEMIDILIDGIFGTHRFVSSILPVDIYRMFTAVIEWMALLVILAVVVFFIRRNFIYIQRFRNKELDGWPKDDANFILIIEFVLMFAFLLMNASDALLQQTGTYTVAGLFPISSFFIAPVLQWFGFAENHLIFIERSAWWLHILGIFFFMNYLMRSKHLHILLAFPNTWYAKLSSMGKMPNLDAVTSEIKLMMSADPYATTETTSEPEKFGASDVFDLDRRQLLNAYSCTECGRCTAVCPANITGKKLSPRKIMMDTRDRLEEVGKNIQRNKKFIPDAKKLLDDYILREELRACTTCNACVQACPILIDPLSIILQLRQYMIMEESSAPQEWNMMMQNIENNGAPWKYNQSQRLDWAKE